MRVALALIGLAMLLVGCGGVSEASGGDKLTLVAYSTPREVYGDLTREFAKEHDVAFDQSYGSSGEQSRAVESGLPADVVAFSLAPDMDRLVESGDVAEDWAADQHKGMVTNSVVVFIVRKGNPKGIKTWDDLVQDGVEVITPNPFTSGGARWNVMAAYGATRNVDYLRKLFENVSVQDKSARESLQTFSGGKGDVLLGYENEAILAQQQGEDLDYVVPDETLLIENPVAVVNESKERKLAQSFVDFLYTPEAQEIFVKKGYRPVISGVPGADEFPEPQNLFEITKFGGWDKVNDEFFDPETGVVAEIFQSQGKSTASD